MNPTSLHAPFPDRRCNRRLAHGLRGQPASGPDVREGLFYDQIHKVVKHTELEKL